MLALAFGDGSAFALLRLAFQFFRLLALRLFLQPMLLFRTALLFELFLLFQPASLFLVLQFFLLQALRLFLGTARLFQSALLRLERFFLLQAFGFLLLLLLAGLFPQLDLGRGGFGRSL